MSKLTRLFKGLFKKKGTPTLTQEINTRVEQQDYYNNLLIKTVGVPRTRGNKLQRQAKNKETKTIMNKIFKNKK